MHNRLIDIRSRPRAGSAHVSPRLAQRKPADGILQAVGQTPLVRLRRFLEASNIKLYAKLEAANPGGSAKDRPAKAMIEEALATGRIDSRATVIESSSGNMGIGLAQACAYHKLRFICVVDPRSQRQNLAIMRALGAEVRLVESPVGGDFLTARLACVQELLATIPGSYWPNQYANQENCRSHEAGTAAEVLAALGRRVGRVYVATSSTGTLNGFINAFAAASPRTRVVGVDAIGSVLFGGKRGERSISGFGAGCEPPLARDCRPDAVIRVSDLDCVVGCRRLAATEAYLAGGSGGGVLQAIRSHQAELAGQTCVAILHDSGARYLDTVYDDQWVERALAVRPTLLKALAEDQLPDPPR
ncbi:putative siderophore biosynthesis protein SbnA [Pirellulimonas nuda]|uniref:N-(2-amino-2-carboxyethyl)-L-glutamate synthase n=1 Tax=Pirellulimonas nuda TaxID=2528009 RepID=A0A518DDJ1_9BACT|nr:putative siderophore biosynthesis protein SbnA [Pirellulimonas nuda]